MSPARIIESALIIYPAIYLGIIIGLYELILIHRDVNFRGSHWLSHGLHAIGWIVVALFVTMNTEYVYNTFTFLQNIPYIQNVLVFRILVGLITLIKIHGVSAVSRSVSGGMRGFKETWWHSLIVAGLVVAMPYFWPFLEPVIKGRLPGL